MKTAAVFAALVAANVALGIVGLTSTTGGLATVIVVFELFWTNIIAKAANLPVTSGAAVDAFPVLWPNALGLFLIALNVALALALHYAIARLIVRAWLSRSVRLEPDR
jgi:hypothetical protein